MDFTWLSTYAPLLLNGAYMTVLLLAISCCFGFLLALWLAFIQINGSALGKLIARGFCIYIRGTPLLLQLWLIYFGLGSLLPLIPGIRGSFIWPIARSGLTYACLSFIINYAAYQAEVIRGALLSVPSGELEAARAFGLRKSQIIRRIWLPRALRMALPTIAGEVVLMLKSTPLAFTVTVVDLYAVAYKVRQDTLLVYEPLIVVAIFYIFLSYVITRIFKHVEQRIPLRQN